jgi:hypothetical protein
MKTKINFIIKGFKAAMLVLALTTVINTNTLKAQDSSFGISVKTSNSMGGLGSAIIPQITYSYDRHDVALGINVQEKNMNVSGLRLGYSFVINPENDNQVFLFTDLAYFENAHLSNKMLRYETTINPENASYFHNVRINSVEQHIGFGVKFFNRGPVNLFAAVGGGVYYTTKLSTTQVFGYRDLKDASVMFNFGINIKITEL